MKLDIWFYTLAWSTVMSVDLVFHETIAHSHATSCVPGLKKAGPFAGHPVEEKCADTVPDRR